MPDMAGHGEGSGMGRGTLSMRIYARQVLEEWGDSKDAINSNKLSSVQLNK